MKKKLLTVLTVTIFAVLGLTAYAVFSNTTGQSDAVIRRQLNCDRPTDDATPTDAYCKNPEKYREDVEKGVLMNEE